jgi:hypothetical protein
MFYKILMIYGNIFYIFGVLCEAIVLFIVYDRSINIDNRVKGRHKQDFSSLKEDKKWVYFLVVYGFFFQIFGVNFPYFYTK